MTRMLKNAKEKYLVKDKTGSVTKGGTVVFNVDTVKSSISVSDKKKIKKFVSRETTEA